MPSHPASGCCPSGAGSHLLQGAPYKPQPVTLDVGKGGKWHKEGEAGQLPGTLSGLPHVSGPIAQVQTHPTTHLQATKFPWASVSWSPGT